MVKHICICTVTTFELSSIRMNKRDKKGFQSTSASHKAIRDTGSALKRSPIQVVT